MARADQLANDGRDDEAGDKKAHGMMLLRPRYGRGVPGLAIQPT